MTVSYLAEYSEAPKSASLTGSHLIATTQNLGQGEDVRDFLALFVPAWLREAADEDVGEVCAQVADYVNSTGKAAEWRSERRAAVQPMEAIVALTKSPVVSEVKRTPGQGRSARTTAWDVVHGSRTTKKWVTRRQKL